MSSKESFTSIDNSTDDPDYEISEAMMRESNFDLGFSTSDEDLLSESDSNPVSIEVSGEKRNVHCAS